MPSEKPEKSVVGFDDVDIIHYRSLPAVGQERRRFGNAQAKKDFCLVFRSACTIFVVTKDSTISIFKNIT